MGSWGKGKKSELCVAGENLLELKRTKGGEGGGSGYGGAHIATETLKMANDFYNLHLIKSKSARIMYNVPQVVREELSQKTENCSDAVCSLLLLVTSQHIWHSELL